MNSDNPYQFSQAGIDPDLVKDPDELEMADLITRLGAAIVDGLFMGLPAGFLLAVFAFGSGLRGGDGMTTGMLIAGVWVLIAVVIQCAQISAHSASLGKKMLGIKIVRMDGSHISWARWLFLRQGITGLIGQIPIAGTIFTLVDTLMIFGSERRCIHDLIADTRVVKV
ncbi:MAG: RDD family protein [Fibrobacterota bacterium]|nr:RDD family protein [Fibrobacterota bacterium]QQS04929.1 MAG: RDD family protein [Fibrobacterota bacterium]